MYSEIVREAQFYLDANGQFYPEATVFILTGENVQYLTSVLNSHIMEYAFKAFYAGGGLGGDGFRYKKQFLVNLPIPRADHDAECDEEALASMLGLSPDELLFIENQRIQ